MSDSYSSLSIFKALNAIDSREYLLPNFQRKFVWKEDQILLLFDSIMQAYPISTFMFWDIIEKHLKENTYYEFNKEISTKFGKKDNHQIEHNTKGQNFTAVIDGQQRLTALYIGLKGSYEGKKLFLNLSTVRNMSDEDNNNQMKYHFEFLSKDDLTKKQDNSKWYEIGEILHYPDPAEHLNSLMNLGYTVEENKVLNLLHSKIHTDKIINFYKEQNQNIDYILTTFVRVNSGGRKLEKSDLLFSFVTSNYDSNFRKKIEKIIKNPSIQFDLAHDFILKVILAISNNPIRFNISTFSNIDINFTEDQQWSQISEAIENTFYLLSHMGYTNKVLKVGNFIIPIIYYLYYQEYNDKPLYKSILMTPQNPENQDYIQKEKNLINEWILIVRMTKFYGNSTDTKTTTIRNIINNAIANNTKFFPLTNIKNELNIKLNEEEIDNLLNQCKFGDTASIAILSVIQPFFINGPTEMDHLHPKSFFTKSNLNKNFKENDIENYFNKNIQDNIANLALIPKNWNRNKSDSPLKQWIEENEIDTRKLLIDLNMPLDISNFKDFIEKRKDILKNKLKIYLKIN